jgi:hypothetical protein
MLRSMKNLGSIIKTPEKELDIPNSFSVNSEIFIRENFGRTLVFPCFLGAPEDNINT